VIRAYDKVFVASRTVTDRSLNIIEQRAEEGFSVALKYPAEEDLHFDWWIVGVEAKRSDEQTNVNSTESNATTTSENLESGILNLESTTTTDPGVALPLSEDDAAASSQESANASSTVVEDTSPPSLEAIEGQSTTTISNATSTGI